MNSGFSICDEVNLPTLSVGDIFIEDIMDFNRLQMGAQGFGIIGIADTRTD